MTPAIATFQTHWFADRALQLYRGQPSGGSASFLCLELRQIVEPPVFSSGTARAKASCGAWSFQGLLDRDELALLLHRRRAFRVHRRMRTVKSGSKPISG